MKLKEKRENWVLKREQRQARIHEHRVASQDGHVHATTAPSEQPPAITPAHPPPQAPVSPVQGNENVQKRAFMAIHQERKATKEALIAARQAGDKQAVEEVYTSPRPCLLLLPHSTLLNPPHSSPSLPFHVTCSLLL